MTSKPTFVFVHGAGHGPEVWDKITSILEKQQYRCIKITLPSTLGSASTTFLEDLQAARQPIEAEVAEGRDVIVVAHSYGGVVGPSAIKGLTSSSAVEGRGNVVGLVMMATGLMPTGMAFLDALGGSPPSTWRIDDDGFAIFTQDARDLFYHDLPEEEGKYWVSMIRKQAAKPFQEGEHVYAGWQDVPVWYLITTQDKGLPVEMQRLVPQMAKAAGVDVNVCEIDSSHSPMLSRPEETADIILEAAKSVSGQ